jgi:hypothetical protein
LTRISIIIRTAIIIITTALFGSTPSEEGGHGWICREATIPGKFAIEVAMTATTTIAITIGNTTNPSRGG